MSIQEQIKLLKLRIELAKYMENHGLVDCLTVQLNQLLKQVN